MVNTSLYTESRARNRFAKLCAQRRQIGIEIAMAKVEQYSLFHNMTRRDKLRPGPPCSKITFACANQKSLEGAMRTWRFDVVFW